MPIYTMSQHNEEAKLDDITRYHLKRKDETNNVIALSFVFGVIVGIVLASFLHQFIVHPLGF